MKEQQEPSGGLCQGHGAFTAPVPSTPLLALWAPSLLVLFCYKGTQCALAITVTLHGGVIVDYELTWFWLGH